MNKLIGITAILTIAMFASGVLAQTNTGKETVICNDASTCPAQNTCVNNACTPIVCGITALSTNGNWITFSSMVPGSGSESPDTTLVTNTGNVIENPTISGDYWYGSQYNIPTGSNLNNYMPIGATFWSLPSPSWNALLVAPGAPIGAISPSGTATLYYWLNVPANTPTDTYQQTITFSSGC